MTAWKMEESQEEEKNDQPFRCRKYKHETKKVRGTLKKRDPRGQPLDKWGPQKKKLTDNVHSTGL